MLWIVIFIIFVIAVALAKGFLEKKEREKMFANYAKVERVMNQSEQALFVNLQKTLGNQYIILSKVRIEDFIRVKEGVLSRKDHWGLRSRIKSRHVDFLICDQATTKPLLALELDGKSHNAMDRQDRDKFVDELYKAIGLPIKHIPVGSNFEELAQSLLEILKKVPS
jgi:hypothetical protein